MSVQSELTTCVECRGEIQPGEDESTYCGSVHAGSCSDDHRRHCAVCDEEKIYRHD